jgi:hypothetical protein
MDPEHEEWSLQLWNSPERWAIISAGGWAAYYNGLAATTIPAAAELGVVGIIGLPVLVMAGVFVALGPATRQPAIWQGTKIVLQGSRKDL